MHCKHNMSMLRTVIPFLLQPLMYIKFRLKIKEYQRIYNYTGWPPPPKKKQQQHRNSRYSQFFRNCGDQQLSFFTLLDRASFPHYNAPRSSNLVENILFHECCCFIMTLFKFKQNIIYTEEDQVHRLIQDKCQVKIQGVKKMKVT